MPSAKPSQNASWAREARALGAISAAVTLTMFAQLAMSAVETVIVARLGVRELAGVTLGLSAFSLMFLATLGVVTAITPKACVAAASRAFGLVSPSRCRAWRSCSPFARSWRA
jgi:MATE family multidrug resistance protein